MNNFNYSVLRINKKGKIKYDYSCGTYESAKNRLRTLKKRHKKSNFHIEIK